MDNASASLLREQSQDCLLLRLLRIHGRRVEAQPMPVPSEGVVIGGEGGPVGVEASLHVAPRHALVRSARPGDAGTWRIEPGNQAMVLAVNDIRVLWGESVALHHGDRVEVGFAQLTAEIAANGSMCAGETFSGQSALLQHTLCLSPSGPTAPIEEPVQASLAGDFVKAKVSPLMSASESAESDNGQEGTASAAQLLADMLVVPSGARAECETAWQSGESGGLLGSISTGEEVLAAIVREAEPPMPAPEPDDILAALAAESTRAVACGGRLPLSSELTDVTFCPSALSDKMNEPFAGSADELFRAGERSTPRASSRASSMEDILEGPLTIDDVLERLRRQTPSDRNKPFHETFSTAEAQTLLDEVARVPDPLLLLAGLDPPPVREPELAPVLHREHRVTGIKTPYRLGVSPGRTDQKDTET